MIAVPADAKDKINSLDDLATAGVKIAAGRETVPVGSYARKVLAGLPPAQEQAILANIKSNEPDVAGVVGKVVPGRGRRRLRLRDRRQGAPAGA